MSRRCIPKFIIETKVLSSFLDKIGRQPGYKDCYVFLHTNGIKRNSCCKWRERKS